MSGRERRRAPKRAAKPSKAEKRRARALEALPSVGADEPATPQARGFDECPCRKDCPLHGECLLCVAYHGTRGNQPRCLR